MDFQNRHPLQRYWDLAAATVQADALEIALDLALFDRLHTSTTAEDVAKALGLHPANTGHLLDLLWSMDLLQRLETKGRGRHAMSYQASPDAQRYLQKKSPSYCGDAWVYRLRSLRHFGAQLSSHVSGNKGASAEPFVPPTGANWANAAKAQIGQEQRAVTVAAAQAIMAKVPEFGRAARFLDLGGGPGWVAIELARARPEIQGVVFDWPETAAVAQQNIEQAGLATRLSVLGGNLSEDELGQDYDLIWCSSVLHFVPEIAPALQKIIEALRPDGVFVCVHAEVGASREAAARVLPYYLPMMMTGRNVTSQGGMTVALRQAGFNCIESFE